MFTALIVKPLFNLLVLIYALLPGHNFGFALIIFTIIIRLLLYPIIKKQLHQAKAMRKLQPELKKIKLQTKGDRKEEQRLTMELYKERGINPFSTLPTTIISIIVLLGLYSGLRRIITDPHNLVNFAYAPIQHLSWMKGLAHDIGRFDDTLFGVVNLKRSALGPHSGLYVPALLIVVISAISQYFQSKQLLPGDKDQRSLRTILREAGTGKQADQSEVNAAVGRSTIYFLPVMIFLFTVNLASALALYWATSGIVAFIQQQRILRDDESEMESIANAPIKDVRTIPEAEIVARKPKKSPAKTKKAAAKRRKKR